MEPTVIIYNKLVRDKIPEIIEAKGSRAVTDILDHSAYEKALNTKLQEEMAEYLLDDSVEELADLVEVIYALLEARGVTIEAFEKIRQAKVEKRGAFQKRIFLKEVID